MYHNLYQNHLVSFPKNGGVTEIHLTFLWTCSYLSPWMSSSFINSIDTVYICEVPMNVFSRFLLCHKKLSDSPVFKTRYRAVAVWSPAAHTWESILFHGPAVASVTLKINPLALELDIYSLAHHLCKMWIFYEPRRVTLGNTRHFAERNKQRWWEKVQKNN
jgi:hypothetical protein